MNDWELLSAFAHGDEQALDALIKKYFPTVYGAAMRQVGDRYLAEDVAQSVFILFSRKAARLPRGVMVGGWLLRTTRFVARDALKQMNRRLKREDKAAQIAAITDEGEPGWATLAPWVDDALSTLSGNEQACVIARFVEGRSLREIGEQHRISEDAAQKRVSRSLEKMRAFLQQHGVKTGTAGLAALLSTELARAADSKLIESAITGVHAALHGTAVPAASVQLANAVARSLLRRLFLKIASTSVLTLALVVPSILVWQDGAEPTVPAGPPFKISDPRIEALAVEWGRVAIQAAQLIRTFSPPPAQNDPRFGPFQQQLGSLVLDGDRIRTQFIAAAPGGRAPSQLAEFLTIELKTTLGLSPRQQSAVFPLLRNELTTGGAAGDRGRTLLRDKAVVGRQLRRWLSRRQQRKFDFTYREDFLGLFTFVKLD